MGNLSQIERKNSGITFTPIPLASFLSEKILEYYTVSDNGQSMVITDPACGEGVLLLSIAQQLPSNLNAQILGYDTNQAFVDKASIEFEKQGIVNSKFVCCDFLQESNPNKDLFSISNEDIPLSDIIIANPPYVRTQLLGAERAQQLAKDFSLSGKIDLYFAFIVAMTQNLKPDGIIGVITSNRYLTTKSGAPIRKYLFEHYEILEVIDLGDTHLFDAAVLPAIFIGKKKRNKQKKFFPCTYKKVYEQLTKTDLPRYKKYNSIYEILRQNESGIFQVNNKLYEYGVGLLKHDNESTGIWQMTSDNENKWLEQIDSHTAFRIGDRFKVRVGIKSCADNVFLNPNWDKEPIQPEPQLMRTLISQENISRWFIDQAGCLKALYPHYSKNGKKATYDIELYPKAKAYLEKHKAQLEGRKYLIEAGRKWYEMWVPQNPSTFDLPKLVFPDISLEPRFTFDKSGSLVNGNCYWIAANNQEEEYLLLLLEGVCNSKLMIKYHDLKFNNKLYSGRRRYLTQYIEKYPIPNPYSIPAERIVETVKLLNSSPKDSIEGLYRKLNIFVEEAFAVSIDTLD